jgi:hypothetical protein
MNIIKPLRLALISSKCIICIINVWNMSNKQLIENIPQNISYIVIDNNY